jgi:hypothetical protein
MKAKGALALLPAAHAAGRSRSTRFTTATLFERLSLAAERFCNRGRNGPDPSRSAHILMHDQPRSPTCRCFLRPHADQIRRRITKKAGKLRDTGRHSLQP